MEGLWNAVICAVFPCLSGVLMPTDTMITISFAVVGGAGEEEATRTSVDFVGLRFVDIV